MNFISNTRKRQILNGLIYILLVIAMTQRPPFFGYYNLSENIRFNMSFIFMWVTIFAFGLYIASEINLWIGFFLFYSMISANIYNTEESGAALLSVILGAILFVTIFHVYNKNAIITIFCLFSVANFIFIIAQLLNLDLTIIINKKLFLPDRQMRMGILDNRNSLSAAFAFCLPVLFDKKLWYGIPIVFAGLIMAKAVGGVISTIPALTYYSYVWLGKKAIIMFIIIACGLFLYIKFIDHPDYKSRWACWKMYGEIRQNDYVLVNDNKDYGAIRNTSLFGAGLGHWKKIFNLRDTRSNRCFVCEKISEWSGSNRPMIYLQAHNEFIQTDMEMGKIGLLLIIGYLINVLVRVRNINDPRPALILLAVIVDSMVYFPFHIPILAMLIILSMVWLEKELQQQYS